MSDPIITGSISNDPTITGQLQPDIVIRGTMDAKFPANVYVASPILLDRTGGNYQFSVDVNAIIASLPPGGVSSVFGRTGDITAQSDDYTFAQIGSKPTTLSGYGITDAQPLDSDLTAIAALTTTSFGRAFLALADAAATRTYLSLVPGTDIQAYDSDLAALAANSTNGLWARTGAGTGAARTITGTANAIAVTNGDGVSGNPTLSISTDAALPGNPTTTTQAVDNNTTRVATTAYVVGQAASATPLGSAATGVVGTSTRFARADHVHPGREVLTASRTYYVRTDGSDSNNGLANTSGGAFLTLQKAWNTMLTLDLGGFGVTIQVGTGTFTAGVNMSSPPIGGLVSFNGVSGTIISTTSADCFNLSAPTTVNISNFELRTTTGGNCMIATGGGARIIGGAGLTFGACAVVHTRAENFGVLQLSGSYAITGAAIYHHYAYGGSITSGGSITVTNTGTNAFSVFANAAFGGRIETASNTYTGGTITGQRFSAISNAVINTFGGGLNYFPGNSAGAPSTNPGPSGGIYL